MWRLFGSVLLFVAADASADVAYHHRDSEQAYECRFAIASFFGSTQPYLAHVRGDDFHAVNLWERERERGAVAFSEIADLGAGSREHYWRIGEFGYRFLGPKDVTPNRYHLPTVEAPYTSRQMPLPTHEAMFLYVEPGPGARCTPTETALLALPDVEWADGTKEFAAGHRKFVETRESRLRNLAHHLWAPPDRHAWSLEVGEQSLYFTKDEGVAPAREFSSLSIRRLSTLPETPKHTDAWCRSEDEPRGSQDESFCRRFGQTPGGDPIWRARKTTNDSRVSHWIYSMEREGALFTLDAMSYPARPRDESTVRSGSKGFKDTSVLYRNGEIEAWFESLERMSVEEALRLGRTW